MKQLKFLLICAFAMVPMNLSLAQGINFPGLKHLRPFLEFKKPQDILPIDIKEGLDPEEIYSVLSIEAAMMDQNYAYAAREALNFIKYHQVDDKIAELAVNYYYTEQEYEQAFEAAKYWYQAQPDNVVAKVWYSTLLGHTGRETALIEILQKNLQDVPENDFSNKLLENVSILEDLKDKQKALHIFEEMVKPFSLQTADYHVLYSDFALRADQTEVAWNEAFKALDVDAESEDAAMRILVLSQGPKRAQGLKFVKGFLDKYPQSRMLYLSYINELTKDEDFDSAIKAIKKMQSKSPEDFDLLYYQALIHYDAEQWATARKVLTQYIDIQVQRQKSLAKDNNSVDSLLTDARKLLIAIYKVEKKYRSALAELNKIMPDNASPEQMDPDLLMEKAQILAQMGTISAALTVLKNGGEHFPNYQGNFLWLGGNLLNESGRTDQAIIYYNDALKIQPKNVDIKYALAMLYEKRGEVWPAEMLLREVMKEEPELADAYNALGYIFADRDYNLTEAQSLLNEAVRLEPANPYILDSMGWLQFRLKNYALALEYLEKAFDMKEEAEIAAHLADVYMALGERDRARDMLQVGKRLNANDRVLVETIKRLNIIEK
ncbi:tetratricopeptide repeat protein [Pelistega suis]|uniref:tetratricopeptide repeat protein n=1 Tax=Pelistega suis TaxID=1631957 RepID=UPI00211C8747|nr:tetratricopeptide repeat protein [Pelistega suis]